MQALKWTAGVIVGAFAFIMIVGSMQPETHASKARDGCYNLKHHAYTPAEKAQAEEICGMLRKEADRKDGRLAPGAP